MGWLSIPLSFTPDEFGAFSASHNRADLDIFDRPISFDFSKEGNCEDFVKIGEASVRVTPYHSLRRVLPAREPPFGITVHS